MASLSNGVSLTTGAGPVFDERLAATGAASSDSHESDSSGSTLSLQLSNVGGESGMSFVYIHNNINNILGDTTELYQRVPTQQRTNDEQSTKTTHVVSHNADNLQDRAPTRPSTVTGNVT